MPGHDIRELRIETTEDGLIVVVCKCGWRSQPHALVKDSAAEWQRHRDAV